MDAKPNYLYFYPSKASFVRKDLAIFQQQGEVIEHLCPPFPKWQTPLMMLKQVLFLLLHIKTARLLIVQFGGYHSFFPALIGKLFNKPCLIILGGYDCYSFPNINYGVFQKRLLSWFVAKSYKLASHLSPVHESMIDSAYTYDPSSGPRQGYAHFIKGIHTKVTPVYNGYEPHVFFNTQTYRRPLSFLTVAVDTGGSNFYRKGIDLILKAALMCPDGHFTIIGNSRSETFQLPANVRMLPPVAYQQLLSVYNEHVFYLQLSMAEGFPNALCEAMLCGCVPIGSDVFAIPSIIANSGFILKNRNAEDLAKLLNEAVHSDTVSLHSLARQRIVDHFTLDKRAVGLLTILANLSK